MRSARGSALPRSIGNLRMVEEATISAAAPGANHDCAAALVTAPDEAMAAIGMLASDALARKHYDEGMKAFARKYFGPMDGGHAA